MLRQIKHQVGVPKWKLRKRLRILALNKALSLIAIIRVLALILIHNLLQQSSAYLHVRS